MENLKEQLLVMQRALKTLEKSIDLLQEYDETAAVKDLEMVSALESSIVL